MKKPYDYNAIFDALNLGKTDVVKMQLAEMTDDIKNGYPVNIGIYLSNGKIEPKATFNNEQELNAWKAKLEKIMEDK